MKSLFKTARMSLIALAHERAETWIYLPPRWYEFSWKGGRYLYSTVISEKRVTGDITTILDNIKPEVSAGSIRWFKYICGETYTHYPREVTVIDFKTYADLIAFKLAHL